MKKLSIIAAALILTACGEREQPQTQVQTPSQPALMTPQAQQAQAVQPAQAPQQVIVQQAPSQDHTMTNMLLGGLIGHAIGSAGNRQAAPVAPAPTTTVVHKTIVNKTVIQQAPAPAVKPVEPPKQVTLPPAPAPARVAPAPSSYKPATTSYSGSGASAYKRK